MEEVLIDAKTAAESQMTPDEARAVVEMWAVHQRIATDRVGHPTVNDVAEGLTIPPSDVKVYLSQVRAIRKRGMRKPRSRTADVALAVLAAGGFAIAMIGAVSFFSLGPSYSSEPMAYEIPTVSAGNSYDADSSNSLRSVAGMDRYTEFAYGSSSNLVRRSISPSRFVFGLDRNIYVPSRGRSTPVERASVLSALKDVVGGPLADHSVVPTRPLTVEELTQAFQNAPSSSVIPMAFESTGMKRAAPVADNGWVQWRSVRVAFGGKATAADLPFALVSDPGLMKEVRNEQTRILNQMADAAMAIANPGSAMAPDVPL